MTDVHRTRRGEVIALHRKDNDGGDSLAAVVPLRGYEPIRHPAPSNSNAADTNTLGSEALGNVIPFMRPRAAETQAPVVALPTDDARSPAHVSIARARLIAFAALSLVLHVAVFVAFFWREPEPLASIGVQAISTEIILGANAPAGAAPTPGQQEQNAPQVAAEQKPDEQTPEAQSAATEQPQDVQVGRVETTPEQPKAEEKTATPEETQPAEQKPAVAMVESPNADTATAAPREVAPDPTQLSLLPQPEKVVEPKPEAKPVVKPVQSKPKPVKNAAPAKERRRIEAPTKDRATRQAKASTASTAANSVGYGRSNADSNYPGTVRAHLARYKQSVGSSTGTATVSFSVGASGGVGSVRLARGSGVAAIDQEVQSMVRRASPFPPPPAGAPRSFTVPVTFRVN